MVKTLIYICRIHPVVIKCKEVHAPFKPLLPTGPDTNSKNASGQ